MKKEPRIYLEHILDALDHITRYVGTMTYEEFFNDDKTHDAIILQCALIGEATRHLPEDFRARHHTVEWKKAVGMRDKLIHDYPGVELEIVWHTITDVLPKFRVQVEEILARKE